MSFEADAKTSAVNRNSLLSMRRFLPASLLCHWLGEQHVVQQHSDRYR